MEIVKNIGLIFLRIIKFLHPNFIKVRYLNKSLISLTLDKTIMEQIFKQNTSPMTTIMDVIYARRSVRSFTSEVVDADLIEELLKAAIQAPCAMHEEPCAFVIIQDIPTLKELSKDIKAHFQHLALNGNSISSHALKIISQDHFEAFYNANTLVVICSQFSRKFTEADCWLAAENLMLAAQAEGLGSCVIGFAVDMLNTTKWKARLDIPQDAQAIAPIILGKPTGKTHPVSRNPLTIYSWKTLALSGR